MTEYLFLQPLDVLYLRGNRLFGAAGDHGEALMPPWPSLAAGAIRSHMLATSGVDLAGFAAGEATPRGRLGKCLGTPEQPGSFRVKIFTLAQKDGGDTVLPFFPLPADVVARGDVLSYLYPRRLHPSVSYGTPAPLPMLPVLRQETPGKLARGRWLNPDGLLAYLVGEPISSNLLVVSDTLWKNDPRLGIAMDTERRTVEKGRIYTTETVAIAEGIGFLVGIDGTEGCPLQEGLLRFGGDGRGATVQPCRCEWPAPSWTRIAKEKRFRLVLSTPGLFPNGWRLPGLAWKDNSLVWQGKNFTARLVAAAVNRAEVVSGWDLACHRPKPAQRVAPVGSVYWFENLEGDPGGLEELMESGLWPLIDKSDAARMAEGFNNVLVAAWPQD